MEGPVDEPERELVVLADQWAAAIVSNDAERIASYVTEEWVIVSAAGVSPREDLLSAVASGKLTHSAMRRVGDVRVRVYGDSAVLTSRVTNTAHHAGATNEADEWTTDVFLRQDERWLCALSHITPAG